MSVLGGGKFVFDEIFGFAAENFELLRANILQFQSVSTNVIIMWFVPLSPLAFPCATVLAPSELIAGLSAAMELSSCMPCDDWTAALESRLLDKLGV